MFTSKEVDARDACRYALVVLGYRYDGLGFVFSKRKQSLHAFEDPRRLDQGGTAWLIRHSTQVSQYPTQL